jgi:type II secretory pathway predicted ATPase ExeA
MNQRKIEQLNALRDIRLPFGPTRAALERLEVLQASGRRPGDGRVLAVVGPSRSGKSTMLGMHVERSTATNERTVRVPRLTLPTKCNQRTFAASVLTAMGDAAAESSTRVQSMTRIPLVAEAMGVEMIMIDEAQHLVNRRNKAINYDAADAIKMLADQVGIPVVLAGTEDLDTLIKANTQLEGRLVGRISVEPFDVGSADSFKELRGFLRLYDRELPFEMTSGLHEEGVARAIFLASDGLIGRITQLLQLAAQQAIAEQRPHLDLFNLSCAWDELSAPSSNRNSLPNPFENVPEPRHASKSSLSRQPSDAQ